MRTQIRGLRMASRNAQDGVSLVQVAEGALQSAQSIMQRIRELTVQAASHINEDDAASGELQMIQREVDELLEELQDIADETEFNGQVILDGNFGGTFDVQVGANSGQILNIDLVDFAAIAAAMEAAVGNGNLIDDPDAVSALLDAIDDQIGAVSEARATLGAQQNRLEFKIANLDNTAENLQAAESRIRDTDMALAMTEFTRNNIMFQASTAMLAQANALPQSVLQLLG
jgi:flagellin